MTANDTKIEVRNVNHPGHTRRVDAAMYEAMKQALLGALPARAPGLTLAQLRERVLPVLPEALYPGGAKAGWWIKAVQLDLEAKGELARERCTPLRLHRC